MVVEKIRSRLILVAGITDRYPEQQWCRERKSRGRS